MVRAAHRALLCAAVAHGAGAVTFSVPSRSGTGNHSYAELDPAPVGISFEFFAFPSYFTNVSATSQCLANWKELTGVWPPIRIGGTTQDRASFDASSEAYVVYSVASPADAPANLTFGPKFMTLAGTYEGSVVVGLNRGKNNITNTIEAAKVAVGEVDNLLAIELGNEPEYYVKDGQPIALSGTWNPATDAASQIDWNIRVGRALDRTDIIQAGNWNEAPPQWGAAELIAKENATAQKFVHHYAHHNYPGGTAQSLQNHTQTANNIRALFDVDVAAARKTGKEYVLGETNSVSGGGAALTSPTFAAALWTLDYTLRAASSHIARIYFHHGTVGNCQYCFWGRASMGAPYWGATTAVAFLARARSVAALDDGAGSYAAYAAFGEGGEVVRVLVVNTVFWDGTGSSTATGQRGSEVFELGGLPGLEGRKVRAKRLTAAKGAMARVDHGDEITFGGQGWANGTCVVSGEETFEVVEVVNGTARFEVQDTEALLVYLQ